MSHATLSDSAKQCTVPVFIMTTNNNNSNNNNNNNNNDEPHGITPLPVLVADHPVHIELNADECFHGSTGTQYRHQISSSSSSSSSSSAIQQPQTQQMAVFEPLYTTDYINGKTVDVNQHFVVYMVKKGLIRVLHRHLPDRALLRAHEGSTSRITDIRFLSYESDVLATVSMDTNIYRMETKTNNQPLSIVIIWRLYVTMDGMIKFEKLLELQPSHLAANRIVWHPFNVNQFFMIHTTPVNKSTTAPPTLVPLTSSSSSSSSSSNQMIIATLVETTRISTTSHPIDHHAVCTFKSTTLVMDGAIQIMIDPPPTSSSSATTNQDHMVTNSNLTDLCWSVIDARYVLTTHDNNAIKLWDMKQSTRLMMDGSARPMCVGTISDLDSSIGSTLSRCCFLPHERTVHDNNKNDSNTPESHLWTSCFVTAYGENSTFTLWSPFGPDVTPYKIQVITTHRSPVLGVSPSYLLDICYGPFVSPKAVTNGSVTPPSTFIVQADRTDGRIYAWHCGARWSQSSNHHLQTKLLLVGCTYVVPFKTKYPVYSWSVAASPTADITEDGMTQDDDDGMVGHRMSYDIKLYSYQSHFVQTLTLTNYMCLPPSRPWVDPTPAVTIIKRLPNATSSSLIINTDGPVLDDTKSMHVSDIGSVDEPLEFEEYDVDEAEDSDDIDVDVDQGDIDVSGEKVMPTMNSASGDNPFANWLGNFVAKSSTVSGLPPGLSSSRSSYLSVNATETIPEAPLASSLPVPIGLGKSVTQSTSNVATQIPDAPMASSLPIALGTEMQNGEVTSAIGSKSSSNGGKGVVGSTPIPSGWMNELCESMMKEIQSTVVPEIKSMIRSSVDEIVPSVVDKVLQNVSNVGGKSDEQDVSALVARRTDETLREAMATNVKNVLIPSLESISGQILAQVSTRLDQWHSPMEQLSNRNEEIANAMKKALEASSAQITQLSSMVKQLGTEVHALRQQQQQMVRASVDANANGSASLHVPGGNGRSQGPTTPITRKATPLLPPVDPRPEILALLEKKQYEAAFTKSVSASTADLALFCCTQTKIHDVLGDNGPALSQPILLCLMQQLGTILVSSHDSKQLSLSLEWLQEIALSLDPSEKRIADHVPNVLQQLVNNINQNIQGGDPSLKRNLQRLLQVVRGMQMR
jgi:hypothetical protein